MIPYILLGLMLGLPLLLGLFFRVSAAHLFLAILSGELLQRTFGDDAELVLDPFIKNDNLLQYLDLLILVLPMVLTAVFMRNTVAKGKIILHIIPLAISGIVFAAFASELLPPSLHGQLESSHYGRMLTNSTEFIIGLMVFLQLITMWLFSRSHERHHVKKKH